MDSDATVDALKGLVRAFCEERDWDQYHNAKELAIGVVTEGSELLDQFRFRSPAEVDAMFTDAAKRDAITEEMSDVLFFLLRMAQMYDIDLSKQLKRKIEINAQKYPISLAKGSNRKYSEEER